MRGMRNPLESWNKSDTIMIGTTPHIGEHDYELALKLIKAGSDHSKFLRQIIVSMDVSAPWYWWKEYATYKVATVENSTSQMHKLGSRLLTKNDFQVDNWDKHMLAMLDMVNDRILAWKKSDMGRDEWRAMIQSVPGSFIYLRTCTLNYAVLRNQYMARRNHKLVEWHDYFEQIFNAPYSVFIAF